MNEQVIARDLTGDNQVTVERSCHVVITPHQVLARIWRPGTTAQRVVTYRLLTTGSLEEKVYLVHLLAATLTTGLLLTIHDHT